MEEAKGVQEARGRGVEEAKGGGRKVKKASLMILCLIDDLISRLAGGKRQKKRFKVSLISPDFISEDEKGKRTGVKRGSKVLDPHL